jgi:hypothetical protein
MATPPMRNGLSPIQESRLTKSNLAPIRLAQATRSDPCHSPDPRGFNNEKTQNPVENVEIVENAEWSSQYHSERIPPPPEIAEITENSFYPRASVRHPPGEVGEVENSLEAQTRNPVPCQIV